MRCPKCGSEVNNDLVFCPVCQNPLKVTADYDYIQAEIGGKVDQMLNEKNGGQEISSDDGVSMKDGKMDVEDPGNTTDTRNVFERDSVFDEHGHTIDERDIPVISRDESFSDDYEELGDYDDDDYDENGGNKKTGLIIGIIAAAVVVVGIIICLILGVFGGKESPNESTELKDVITCNVEEGSENATPLKIILKSELGNRMYYTLDGSNPSVSSDMYTGSLVLDDSLFTGEKADIELKVVSYTDNSMKSGEFSVKFTLLRSELAAPYISPSSGNYSSLSEITITAQKGAKIYYTFDGTTPTRDSELYTEPIKMKRGNNILSAIAVLDNMESPVATCVYNVDVKPVFNYDQAVSIVIRGLIEAGLIKNESGDVGDGTSRRLFYITMAIIDNNNYYVIEVDHFSSDGELADSITYGVDDQTGYLVRLQYNGTEYIIYD